jgi:hypothetical protein
MYGRKEDLLKGDTKEKMKRWKANDTRISSLEVVVRSEPVVFKVVD